MFYGRAEGPSIKHNIPPYLENTLKYYFHRSIPWDYTKLIESRYSVRAYSAQPVEDEKTGQSAGGGAPWHRPPANRPAVQAGRGCIPLAGRRSWGQIYRRPWFCAGAADHRCLYHLVSSLGAGGRSFSMRAWWMWPIAMDHLVLAATGPGGWARAGSQPLTWSRRARSWGLPPEVETGDLHPPGVPGGTSLGPKNA